MHQTTLEFRDVLNLHNKTLTSEFVKNVCPGCFKMSFTSLEAYVNSFGGYVQL
jgi:hypothetical protein